MKASATGAGAEETVTLLGDVEATGPGRVVASGLHADPALVAAATGWELKPEGACRGAVCVPLRERGAIERDGLLDVAALAAALGAPHAAEVDARVAALGEPAPLRAVAMDELTLPDLTLARVGGPAHGEPFALRSIGRKKKVLVAWASW